MKFCEANNEKKVEVELTAVRFHDLGRLVSGRTIQSGPTTLSDVEKLAKAPLA